MRAPRVFGQYVPVASAVHRLDARTKMGLVAAFTVCLFATDDWAGLAVAGGAVGVALALSRVPPRIALRGVRAVSLILLFTMAAHSLRWESATVALMRIGPLAVDRQGFATGAYFALRIVLLVVGTSLLTLTTTPVQLTDALERLMRPLERVRFPVTDVAMMLSIALRFIPTTAEEAERIMLAQTARGARFDRGGLIARTRAYTPVLVPLFVNLFRRADELAVAMESRCYRGGPGRTRLNVPVMRVTDWVTFMVVGGALVGAGIIL